MRLPCKSLFAQGGFFKAHRLIHRGDPGFVGSLVVCLPSAHAGGALRVKRGGHSVLYDWGRGAGEGEVQWAGLLSTQTASVRCGAEAALQQSMRVAVLGSASTHVSDCLLHHSRFCL